MPSKQKLLECGRVPPLQRPLNGAAPPLGVREGVHLQEVDQGPQVLHRVLDWGT